MYRFLNGHLMRYFSEFKTKCKPLQQKKYASLQQFYNSLSKFQKTLNHLEKIKFSKKIEDFGKKFNRIYKQTSLYPSLPLQMSHTSEFFFKKRTQIFFGTQDTQKQPSSKQLVLLSEQTTKLHLDLYKQSIVYQTNSERPLYDSIEDRFKKISQHFCRNFFHGYRFFSKSSLSLEQKLKNKKTQYKGNFKFKIKNGMKVEQIETLAKVVYNCSLFNKCQTKMIVAIQIIVMNYLLKISNECLKNCLFILAFHARSLKIIEQNIIQVTKRMEKYHFQMLFYMCTTSIEQNFFLEFVKTQNIVFSPKNGTQYQIMKTMNLKLKNTFQLDIPFTLQFLPKSRQQQSEAFFTSYLTRQQYTFDKTYLPEIDKNMFEIQGKNFICLDPFLIDQSFKLNGLGSLIRQMFLERQKNVKMINWARIMQTDKRGQKDEYLDTKMKGLIKPIKKRQSYYD